MEIREKQSRHKGGVLKGFTLFEVLIYLGIFFFMAGALLSFSWDVLDLGNKDRIGRHVFSDARFVTERLKSLIRESSGADISASVWNDANGKLVLEKLGSSDTVTIELQDGIVTLIESGQPSVRLHSTDTRVTELRFVRYGSQTESSEYIDFTLGCESAQKSMDTRSLYDATTTIQSGVAMRNSGL